MVNSWAFAEFLTVQRFSLCVRAGRKLEMFHKHCKTFTPVFQIRWRFSVPLLLTHHITAFNSSSSHRAQIKVWKPVFWRYLKAAVLWPSLSICESQSNQVKVRRRVTDVVKPGLCRCLWLLCPLQSSDSLIFLYRETDPVTHHRFIKISMHQ